MKRGMPIIAFLLLVYFVHLWAQWLEKRAFSWTNTLLIPPWSVTHEGLERIWFGVFILSSTSGALLWIAKKSKARTLALELWFGWLALNVLWHLAFFYYHSPLMATVAFIVLFFVIGANIFVSKKVDLAATILLVPNLIWVLYAIILLGTISYIN